MLSSHTHLSYQIYIFTYESSLIILILILLICICFCKGHRSRVEHPVRVFKNNSPRKLNDEKQNSEPPYFLCNLLFSARFAGVFPGISIVFGQNCWAFPNDVGRDSANIAVFTVIQLKTLNF